MRSTRLLAVGIVAIAAAAASGQRREFVPVTQAMLERPADGDWLMFSRTYDAQRYSPLDEIRTGNVDRLEVAWTRVLDTGTTETVPLVYAGVMYVVTPGAQVEALDAATGEAIWVYRREMPAAAARAGRTKNLAIAGDVIVYTAPDSFVVGLDARTGAVRWETRADSRGHTSGPLVVNGLAISGGACSGNRDNCYIAAHDVASGREVWRFQTTPGRGEPGDASWNGAAVENRQASAWGFPGSYDPGRGLLYWGIANPMPDQRSQRHDGDPDGTSRTTPADLYSNSTVALDPATGGLAWYYQHLPGDDWDLDATHERTLVTTEVAPDPRVVKWINPRLRAGERRDVAVTLTEGGGLFVLDREDGEFLWGMPFPVDAPETFAIADIDGATGAVTLNRDLVLREPGQQETVCYWNTRSYWPTAYHPGTNSLYTSYIDACREITVAADGRSGPWRVVPRPGGNPAELTGLARIDLRTGEIMRFDVGRAPGNGALLATAGGLVFHGDMSGRFSAFDARTGTRLWSTMLGGNVSVSTIAYAAGGRQYVAVMTGDNLKVPELAGLVPELQRPPAHNAIYAFALPR